MPKDNVPEELLRRMEWEGVHGGPGKIYADINWSFLSCKTLEFCKWVFV